MIDFMKLKGMVRLSTKVSEMELEKFIRYTKDFFEELYQEYENVSSYEALEILSLVFSCKSFIKDFSKFEKILFGCLKKVREGIYNDEFHPFSTFAGIGYVAFLMNQISDEIKELIPFSSQVNELLVNNVKNFLTCNKNNENFSNTNYELIYGLSGTLQCVSELKQTECIKKIKENIVMWLCSKAEDKMIYDYIVPKWHYYRIEKQNWLGIDESKGLINYGVSHGLGGPLGALTLYYKTNKENEKVNMAINEIWSEYTKTVYHIENIVYWPEIISFDQYIGKKSIDLKKHRMGWCYGSIGILRVLFQNARVLQKYELEKKIEKEMIKIASMKNSEYQLTSPIVCHGLAGAALIMNEMYNDTQSVVFKEKTIALVDDIIRTYCLFFEGNCNDENIEKYSYVDGISGILQAIISIIGYKDENPKRLLIK